MVAARSPHPGRPGEGGSRVGQVCVEFAVSDGHEQHGYEADEEDGGEVFAHFTGGGAERSGKSIGGCDAADSNDGGTDQADAVTTESFSSHQVTSSSTW